LCIEDSSGGNLPSHLIDRNYCSRTGVCGGIRGRPKIIVHHGLWDDCTIYLGWYVLSVGLQVTWTDGCSNLHGAIHSIGFWSRVRLAINTIVTLPSERKIRCHNMPSSGGAYADRDMAAIIFCSLQCLLCIVGVVCGAIWLLGVEVVDYRWIIDDLGRYHNLCEIINGELD